MIRKMNPALGKLLRPSGNHEVLFEVKKTETPPARYEVLFSFRSLCLLLAVFTTHMMQGQFTSRTITPQDGLTMGYINSLYQDRRGFIWAGTFFGLNRLDGRRIVNYTPNHLDRWSLHANEVMHITEDKYGLLWLGTDNGLAVMEPVTERIVQINNADARIPALNTKEVFVASDNRVWFYQESASSVALYSVLSSEKLAADLQKGSYPSYSLDLDSIVLPTWIRGGISLFQPLDKETLLMGDRQGRFVRINLPKKICTEVSLATISVSLAGGMRYIPNALTGGGTLVPKDHDFQNMMKADHLQEILPDASGRPILFRFYNKDIKDATLILEGRQLPDEAATLHSIPYPASMARCIDSRGRFWIGTVGYGLETLYEKPPLTDSLVKGVNVYNFTLLPGGWIWPGAYAPDVKIHLQRKQKDVPEWQALLPQGTTVNCVICDAGTNRCFLSIKDPGRKTIRIYAWDPALALLTDTGVQLGAFGDTPPVMALSGDGHLWISGAKGELIRYHIATGTKRILQMGDQFPASLAGQLLSRDLKFDRSGNLWVSTNFGLVRVWNTRAEMKSEAFFNDKTRGNLFVNHGIFVSEPDRLHPGVIWLGTLGGGLAAFEYETKKVTYYNNDWGRHFTIVLGMLGSDDGTLWLATDKGLVCFDTKKRIFLAYRYQKELYEQVFSATAQGILPDGRFAFGGGNGLYGFRPKDLLLADVDGKQYVSAVDVNGLSDEDIRNTDNALILTERGIPRLTLPHSLNNLRFTLSSPGARTTDKIMYRYRITGLTPVWSDVDEDGTISLSGVPPGEYTLEVIMSGTETYPDSPTDETIVYYFTILPPWYQTRLAIVFYVLILSLAVWGLFRYDRRRLILKHEADLSRQEMERLQSLDQFKNNFFAFIAHEFKSPLTIILGLSEKLRTLFPAGKESGQLVDSIQKETNNVLELIHEMIDITKIQDSTLEFQSDLHDFHLFIQQLAVSWQTVADVRDIKFIKDIPSSPNYMLFDSLRYRHIFNNLISNAIRHTPSGGHILISVQPAGIDTVTVCIQDSGTGIAAQNIEHIFDKYYREEDSKNRFHFGLGLTLVKELVTLLDGHIEVQSELQKGTRFCVTLPVHRSGEQMQTISEQSERESEATPLDTEPATAAGSAAQLPIVLLVDDDLSLLTYMKSILINEFTVLVAKDGREGLKMASEEVPDIIVTDVMMPHMDGLDLTHAVKTSQLTSHIPVIMLSIRAAVEDRLAGQRQGADFYMAKPFLGQELLLAAQNLYSLQQKWKERYGQPSQIPSIESDHPTFNSQTIELTDAFMQSLYQVFEKEYGSDTLDIKQICQEMHISRSQLQRKLAAITGATPMELLRDFRLEMAKKLLETNLCLTIKEVAFQTGFKQPPHFTRLFLQKYGIAPSDIRKKKG